MQKPLHLLTPEEKAELMKELLKEAENDHLFTGALGNKNSFFIARPDRRIKPATQRKAKVSA